ncbi:MAG: malT [Deltaproteobacteria bacterium]|nr:malT [Deltaproteobacteria bacterium]
MTGDTTRRLTGREGSEKVLSFLHRNNYFTEMYPGAEPIYRYHALFRKFLLERARQAYPPEEVSRLCREAAGILSESGQVEDALTLLQTSGDREALQRLILAEAGDLLRQGRAQTLLTWLMSIPADEQDANPWLLYWMGSSHFPQDLMGSLACFGKAFDGFREPDGTSGKFLSWAGAVDAILAERNDLFLLDRWIDWLDRRALEEDPFPSVEIEARVSGSMVGALLYRRPHHPNVRAWMDRALSASRALGDGFLILQSLIRAANYHQWMGDKAAASLALEEIRLLSRSPTVSPVHVVFGKWLEASILLWAEADAGAALRVVSEGLDASRRLGVHLWDHFLFAAGARAALHSGDGKAAGEYLEKMKAAMPPGRHLAEAHHSHHCAWMHLLRGDLQRAAENIRRALAHAESTGVIFAEILCRLSAANIAEERGEREEARAYLLGIGDRIRSYGNRMFEFMERLTEARVAFGSGDEPGGLSALREGFEIGRKQGYVNLFHWWEPAVMTRLCLKALDAGIEPAYVVDLIRKRGLSPEVPPMEIEAWPWKVRIHTMGRFSVACDGKRVGFQGKAQQKPLHLLKALIALGGRDVPRESSATRGRSWSARGASRSPTRSAGSTAGRSSGSSRGPSGPARGSLRRGRPAPPPPCLKKRSDSTGGSSSRRRRIARGPSPCGPSPCGSGSGGNFSGA